LTLTLAFTLALTLALTLSLALPLILGSSDTQATDTGDPEEYCYRPPCPALADAMHNAPSPVVAGKSEPIHGWGPGQAGLRNFWRVNTRDRAPTTRLWPLGRCGGLV
jgi:hypothetical protein